MYGRLSKMDHQQPRVPGISNVRPDTGYTAEPHSSQNWWTIYHYKRKHLLCKEKQGSFSQAHGAAKARSGLLVRNNEKG